MSLSVLNHCNYRAGYDSSLLRGKDDPLTPRPWNLWKLIQSQGNKNSTLLDIGCGSAFKLIPLAPYFKQIIGIEPSEEMRALAQKKISNSHINNIRIKAGVAENLPISDQCIDVVTVMLARWDVSEIYRVLQKNGVVILEYIGCEDKKLFKQFFGKDVFGWRGQFLDYATQAFLANCKQAFLPYFADVALQNGFWQTFYTRKGIDILLQHTPTIRCYDHKADQKSLEKAIQACMQNGKICLTQNRVLLYAQHPKPL